MRGNRRLGCPVMRARDIGQFLIHLRASARPNFDLVLPFEVRLHRVEVMLDPACFVVRTVAR